MLTSVKTKLSLKLVHGSAPDIAGQNKANPTALLLSACSMLDYMDQNDVAEKIRSSVYKTLATEDGRTGDLGGSLSTSEYTEKLISNL